MAILHRADIRPSKLELLNGWLPNQPWYSGAADPQLVAVGAYRFDDPEGEVGIETHLLRTDAGHLLQVPLTYRGTPLPGGQHRLIGTMQHSVLGQRWVYDACGDPVYVTVLSAAILGDGTQAEELVEAGGRREHRTPTVSVAGTHLAGAEPAVVESAELISCQSDHLQTVIIAAGLELVVRRVIDPAAHAFDGHALTGTWAGRNEAALLATVRERDL